MQNCLVNLLCCLSASRDEVSLCDSQILNVCFQLCLNKFLKLLMDSSVLKSVLLSFFENDTVFIDKFNDWILPNRRLEVFRDNVKDPFLIIFS